MKTAVIAVLCFIAGLVSWWTLEQAYAAGWVKTEWNAAISGGGTVPPGRKAEIMHHSIQKTLKEPSKILRLLMLFQLPTLAVILFQRRSILQYAVLGMAVVLLVADLGVAAAPDGGDFKGCTKCDGSYLAHMAFAFIAFLSSVIAVSVLVLTHLGKRKHFLRRHSTQQSAAADRRENAAPAER